MGEVIRLADVRRVVPLRPASPVRTEPQSRPVAAAVQPDDRPLGVKLSTMSRLLLGPRGL